MASSLTGILQVVVTRNNGTIQTIKVDPGANLQAVVFDRAMADHCPGPHADGPAPGIHPSTTTAPTADTTLAAASTTTSSPGRAGGGATTMGDNCYIVNGVVYCPPTQG